MLNTIYMILDVAIIVLILIFIITLVVTIIKKRFNNTKTIKARILFSSILVILFILKIIFSIVLQKLDISLVSAIFCAALWACSIASQKKALDILDFKSDVIVDSDDSNIIEADVYEIIDENENTEKILSLETNK